MELSEDERLELESFKLTCKTMGNKFLGVYRTDQGELRARFKPRPPIDLGDTILDMEKSDLQIKGEQ